jgi:hypothetical protein
MHTDKATDRRKPQAGFHRFFTLWLTLCLGTLAAILLGAAPGNPITPLLPFTISLAGIAVMGVSSICLWGLLFVVPIYYLSQAWLRQAQIKLLPFLFLLQALLTTLYYLFAGEMPWRQGGQAGGLFALLLLIYVVIYGPADVRRHLTRRTRILKRWLRRMRSQDDKTPERSKPTCCRKT